jgi:hypothetical protein
MAGGEADEGLRRRREGGGLERSRDFPSHVDSLTRMKGRGYLPLNLGFYRLEWKMRAGPSKFLEGLKV